MGNPLAEVKIIYNYKKYKHEKRVTRRSIAIYRNFLSRSRKTRLTIRQKRCFTEVKKLFLLKKQIYKKLIRGKSLSPVQKRKLPALFQQRELELVNDRDKLAKQGNQRIKEAEKIIQDAENGKKLDNGRISTIIQFFGGLKPAITYSNLLTIAYNDKVVLLGHPKKALPETKAMKYLRKRLDKQAS